MRVLVADDQPSVLEALKLLLKGEGYEVEAAASPGQVLAAVEARDFVKNCTRSSGPLSVRT